MELERIEVEQARALGAAGVAQRLRALVPGVESVQGPVREIVSAVRGGGDAALTRLIAEHDLSGAASAPSAPPLLVSEAELDAAIMAMPREVVAGLQVAIANVSEVAHRTLGESGARVQLPQGHTVSMREIPVDSAAVYVPGGRAPYPSTAVMGVVTARAAGVLDVCVCAPPRAGTGAAGDPAATPPDIHPVILGACRLLGVERVYRMGGAHAIAALAYGTETVRRVDVIVGPGNLYVQEAKRQVCADVGIDSIAGPTDLVMALAGDADPRLAALDLLAQAEHGRGSLAAAVCADETTLQAVQGELERIAGEHPEIALGALALVCAGSAREAVAIADRIAPEHLQLMGAEAEALAAEVRHAGCLFVGAASATAFGDYVAGSNHVLPTGGAARFASTLNVATFTRRMAEVQIGSEAAALLARAGAPVAEAEGFRMHALSMRARGAEVDRAQIGENQGP